MVGITRIATYVPRRRLDRAVVGQTWGTRVAPGRRSVAGLDEDPLTMAVDAVLAFLGDGAAAVAVGTDRVIAELISSASVAEEFTYFWRTDEQRTVQVAEQRFGASYGYARDVAEAVTAALRKAELPPTSVAGLALGA